MPRQKKETRTVTSPVIRQRYERETGPLQKQHGKASSATCGQPEQVVRPSFLGVAQQDTA